MTMPKSLASSSFTICIEAKIDFSRSGLRCIFREADGLSGTLSANASDDGRGMKSCFVQRFSNERDQTCALGGTLRDCQQDVFSNRVARIYVQGGLLHRGSRRRRGLLEHYYRPHAAMEKHLTNAFRRKICQHIISQQCRRSDQMLMYLADDFCSSEDLAPGHRRRTSVMAHTRLDEGFGVVWYWS